MKHRRYYLRRMFRTNRPAWGRRILLVLLVVLIIQNREKISQWLWNMAEIGAVEIAEQQFKDRFPDYPEMKNVFRYHMPEILSVLEMFQSPVTEEEWTSEDPAYERLLASEWEKIQYQKEEKSDQTVTQSASSENVFHEKLADFDFVLQNFYSVHPTTTAGSDVINAWRFMNMDLTVKKNGETPQILIYHTHSQEEYADYAENPQATIVGAGAYLAELLEERGYRVMHDTSQYDVKGGELDRSQAYTYALDGINGILQKYPSIEVVLDLHRDGVAEGTRLVTEVDGKNTAQIMFFNGISQTPDGPIEYLPNPNREGNLAFSFQLQMKAAEQYPGLTRKIYLKGLRYNQHVRARAALIEVGAQTNTYAEALNAMEPLADILCRVLDGTG